MIERIKELLVESGVKVFTDEEQLEQGIRAPFVEDQQKEARKKFVELLIKEIEERENDQNTR